MPVLQRARHEFFVREYIRNGGNGADAYREAAKRYPNKPLRGEDCAKAIAYRILRYPEVQNRYKELQAQMAKRADITIDKILTDYQKALAMAEALAKPGEMVAAATAQAKLVGLLRDRVETGQPGDFEHMDNISEILAAVEAEAGADAALALAKAFGLGETEITAPAGSGEVNEEDADLAEAEPASSAVN